MAKAPTKAQRARWDKMREHGCMICGGMAAIHHCETGMGGRKNHDKVIPLCHYHHQGEQGIHSMARRPWQETYGTEQELMARINKIIDAQC
jgi:hypothetical protein